MNTVSSGRLAWVPKGPSGNSIAEARWLGTRPNPRKPSAVQHPEEPGLVTLAGKPGDELAPGTLNSVLKQAGLK